MLSPADFAAVMDQHWQPVYNFCFRMTLDQGRAADALRETFMRAWNGREKLPSEDAQVGLWLMRIANVVLEGRLPRTPELNFDILDDTLRSEATRTDVVRSLAEPERDFLLWELKQGCMTAVINCLSPGERSAFTLAAVFKMNENDAAAALNITPSAFKVRLSRARKKVADYLAPRCEHVDPNNPCRCPARVGIAVDKGFIRSAADVVALRKPVAPFGRYGVGPEAEDAPLRDVIAIYSNLPEPEAPADMMEKFRSELESGSWDRKIR